MSVPWHVVYKWRWNDMLFTSGNAMKCCLQMTVQWHVVYKEQWNSMLFTSDGAMTCCLKVEVQWHVVYKSPCNDMLLQMTVKWNVVYKWMHIWRCNEILFTSVDGAMTCCLQVIIVIFAANNNFVTNWEFIFQKSQNVFFNWSISTLLISPTYLIQ